jgi:glutathione S-transferase
MDKKIKIWGRANSGNVKKVLVVADELNIPYERIDAGMQFGVVDTPEYRKLNPNGRVPTIEDGDYVLWESHAICRYLAMQYGGEAIYPSDPKVRAGVDRWLDWMLAYLIPVEAPVFSGTIRTPPEKRDTAMIEDGVKKLVVMFQIVEDRLTERPYLEGNQATLADLLLGVFAYRYLKNPFLDRPTPPNLVAWCDRLCARPSYKKWVDQPLT